MKKKPINFMSSLEKSFRPSFYQVDIKKLHTFLLLYYSLVLFVGTRIAAHTWTLNFDSSQLRWPVKWIASFDLTLGQMIVSTLLIAAPLIALLNLRNKYSKLFVTFCLWQGVSLYFSSGHLGHYLHGLLMSSLFVALVPYPQSSPQLIERSKAKFYIWCAQMAFVMPYFLSGVWKTRDFINTLIHHDLTNLNPMLYVLSTRSFERKSATYPLDFFYENPTFSIIIWISVILFECSFIAIPFLRFLQIPWAIFIVMFHISTLFLMNISYFPAPLLAIILLIFTPYKKTKTSFNICTKSIK